MLKNCVLSTRVCKAPSQRSSPRKTQAAYKGEDSFGSLAAICRAHNPLLRITIDHICNIHDHICNDLLNNPLLNMINIGLSHIDSQTYLDA